jgi:DNA-binding transcriptional ArsR family regulator
MVKQSARALDATFGALSDATRRGILASLARGESSVSELAAPYDISLPAVSKHLSVLEEAGLVVRRKDGRVHRCRLVADPMREAADWIEFYRRFWEQQLDALERFLKDHQGEEKQTWPRHSKPPKRSSKSGA